MGVFAVIGLVVFLIGLAKWSGPLMLSGLLLFGIGVAGDRNGF